MLLLERSPSKLTRVGQSRARLSVPAKSHRGKDAQRLSEGLAFNKGGERSRRCSSPVVAGSRPQAIDRFGAQKSPPCFGGKFRIIEFALSKLPEF